MWNSNIVIYFRSKKRFSIPQTVEKIRESVKKWSAEDLCGRLPNENIRKFTNKEMGKSGDQEIKLMKNVRKSGERREGLKASVAISLAQFRLPLMFHLPSYCSTHWSHWSALINNSLPLKPDFHASLNKFVVGPVGCCHIWQVAQLSWIGI